MKMYGFKRLGVQYIVLWVLIDCQSAPTPIIIHLFDSYLHHKASISFISLRPGHIYESMGWTIIGYGNDLSPVQRQATT